MDITKRQLAILFLDRNSFDFFVSGAANALRFQFSENVIASLEIVNMEVLENQIKLFVEQNSIPSARITMILSSNVVFEKDLPETVPLEQKEEDVQKFWGSVPFEDINSKTIKLDNGQRIIAVNNNLYEGIKTSFEKIGFVIETIVPYEALGPDLWNITYLDPQNSREILKRVDSFKEYSFDLPEEDKVVNNPQTKKGVTSPEKAPPKTRFYIMAGVFIFLIVVLAILLIKR